MRLNDSTAMADRSGLLADIPVLMFCGVLVLSVVAVIPYWLGQAFAYSAAYGRTQPEAMAAEALFHCRARLIASLSMGIVVLSVLLRLLQLRFAHSYSWLKSTLRSTAEQLGIGIACWLLLAVTGVPKGIGGLVSSFADSFCRR
jgi:hypothetical protein